MTAVRHTERISGSRLGGYLLTALGVLVLVGWQWQLSALLSVLPGEITMKPNTAIGFLCAGLSLILLTSTSGSERSRRAAAVPSVIVMALGLCTLIEYLLHVNLGIDQLLYLDRFQFPYP